MQVTSSPNASDLSNSESSHEFVSRHALDGKFTFVDHRVINLMGFTPPELLGMHSFRAMGQCAFRIFYLIFFYKPLLFFLLLSSLFNTRKLSV